MIKVLTTDCFDTEYKRLEIVAGDNDSTVSSGSVILYKGRHNSLDIHLHSNFLLVFQSLYPCCSSDDLLFSGGRGNMIYILPENTFTGLLYPNQCCYLSFCCHLVCTVICYLIEEKLFCKVQWTWYSLGMAN